jgi:hypothetical protein
MMIAVKEPEPEPDFLPGYLEWLRQRVAEFRKKWPKPHTCNPKKLAKEKYRKRQTDDRGS